MRFHRVGVRFVVDSVPPKPIQGSLIIDRLVGVLEAAFVGHLALLASITRPLTVALDVGQFWEALIQIRAGDVIMMVIGGCEECGLLTFCLRRAHSVHAER